MKNCADRNTKSKTWQTNKQNKTKINKTPQVGGQYLFVYLLINSFIHLYRPLATFWQDEVKRSQKLVFFFRAKQQ